MKIWEVSSDVTNFALIHLKAREDYDRWPYFGGQPLGDGWEVFKGRFARGLPVGSFTYVGPGNLICQANVVAALPAKAREEVEVLPLDIKGHDVRLLNVINVIDCLDESRSDITRFKSGRVLLINKYVFDEGRLRGVYLFKIPQLLRTEVYATDLFRSFIDEHGFTGLEFKQLWE